MVKADIVISDWIHLGQNQENHHDQVLWHHCQKLIEPFYCNIFITDWKPVWNFTYRYSLAYTLATSSHCSIAVSHVKLIFTECNCKDIQFILFSLFSHMFKSRPAGWQVGGLPVGLRDDEDV